MTTADSVLPVELASGDTIVIGSVVSLVSDIVPGELEVILFVPTADARVSDD
jgi:hypothetical protein